MKTVGIFPKLFKIALITSLLFGLAGAMPGVAMHDFEMERVSRFFLYMTGFSLYMWLINILLVKYLSINGQKAAILRFGVSIIICIISAWLVNLYLVPHGPDRRFVLIPFESIRDMVGDSLLVKRLGFSHPPARIKMIIFPILQSLSINIIIIVLTELVLLKQTKLKVDSENEQLRMANLQARNSQLQQQLHPHFLFNSLSTLRSLVNRSPEKAEEYIEKLSELLRFSTNNSHQSLVSIKEEVELCTNYLVMQQTRFGSALDFSIDIPFHLQEHGKVPLFALQQLAENAIKHNALTKEQPLFIKISSDNTSEWITVKNNLQPKQVIEYSNGIGLANLSERYQLTGVEDIVITKNDNEFSVVIKIVHDAGNNN